MNYDILNIFNESETIKAENTVICSIKKSSTEKIGFRRFENGKFFQTSKVGSADLDQLMSESRKWGGHGLPMDYAFAQAVKDKKSDIGNSRQKVEEFKQGLEFLKQKYPQFVFNGSCASNQVRTTFKSSYGVDLESEGTQFGWYLIFQKKGSGNVFDGYFQGQGTDTDISGALKQGMNYLNTFDKVVEIKDGKYPVVMGDSDSQMSPFNKLTESFVANKYHDGAALFSSKLGQKLFSDKITLCDQAYEMKKNHPNFFDGEGTVRTSDLTMIEQGVFKNLFYDLRFADKYKTKTTGNGLRAYNQGVTLAPRDLYFKPGKRSWKDIIKDHDRCVVVNIAAGGDGNDLGEYSTPVQAAYVYEKGELIGRAPQITIKTSVQRALNEDLIDVSSDGFSGDTTKGIVVSMMDVFNN
jgi:PmbA protein